MEALELIKKDLAHKNLLHKYVILKKDDKGYYLEYAFTEGAPHDNRCISWYHSYQEEAYIRNGWVNDKDNNPLPEDAKRKRLDAIKADREAKVGKVYELYSFTCGGEENPDEQVNRAKEAYEKYHIDEGVPFIPQDHICKVGCPAKACSWHTHWTYEQPVKCACWALENGTTMEDFINNYKISMNATELAELMNK